MNQTQTPTGRSLALAAALLLASGPAAAGLEDPVSLTAEQRAAFGIEVAEPQPADRVLSRRYPGQVTVPVRQSHVVSAPLDGTLASLLVAEGEAVEAGQPLARMQSPGLVETQGALLEALSKLNLARSELDRDRALFAEGLAPKRRLEASQAQFNELATTVDQWSQRLLLSGMPEHAIEDIKRDRRLSGTLELRSPIAGVVLEQMVSTGQAVAAATPLFRIARLTPLWLEIHVPLDALAGLLPGAQVVLPREEIRGRILTVGRQVHGEDQGVLVRAEVTEGTDRLRPGQFVEVQVSHAAGTAGEPAGEAGAATAWRVPAAAVVRHAGGAYLFAERGGGFVAVPVELLSQEEHTAVVSGPLIAKERIAVTGIVALKAAWLGAAE
jgi:membrane fusion protein, heavy metal efflux system